MIKGNVSTGDRKKKLCKSVEKLPIVYESHYREVSKRETPPTVRQSQVSCSRSCDHGGTRQNCQEEITAESQPGLLSPGQSEEYGQCFHVDLRSLPTGEGRRRVPLPVYAAQETFG
ncbi:hypothetical protein BSL78_25356 [Apostichopus japonicus]|uniref:Uncharacterized protein n=1 Tax=Stichopus japonicus TaxID=307972 RepID=A0A2G8JQ14_STIJA|nr:hypothetical protein BSL78_25356 [Apostichopus japonicus]